MNDTAAPPRLEFCVCVPVRNEAAHLEGFLEALTNQDIPCAIPLAICLNNTTDRSRDIIIRHQEVHAGRLRMTVDHCTFPPELAHAGSARRRAMDLGVDILDSGDPAVLIATDADTRPPPDWISANLREVRRGADIVGGYLLLDESDGLPPEVVQISAMWHQYWALVRAIEDSIDPRPWDPAPRHGDHTGASLAITTRAYQAAGGVPIIASGEDKALVEAATAAGFRLVHPLDVWTRVSARRQGRASGGMADAMVSLFRAAETGEIVRAPGLDHWHQRALWRRRLREQLGAPAIARAEAALPAMPNDTPLRDIVAGLCPA